jgi:hypothetical protein
MKSIFWMCLIDGILVVCMVVMFLGVLFLCAWMYPPMHEAKKMDCSLIEFSPDYSAEIKQLCREARSKK